MRRIQRLNGCSYIVQLDDELKDIIRRRLHDENRTEDEIDYILEHGKLSDLPPNYYKVDKE